MKAAGGAGAAFLEVAAAPMMGDAPPLEGEGAHAFLVEREHLSFGNKLDQGMLPAEIEFCFFSVLNRDVPRQS